MRRNHNGNTTNPAVCYNIAVKLAGEINAFLFATCFTTIAMLCHVCCLIIYKCKFPQTNEIYFSKQLILLALFAGVSTVIIDLAFFFAMKHGSYILTSSVAIIGAMALSRVIGYFIFNEILSWEKLLGLFLGFVATYLLVK